MPITPAQLARRKGHIGSSDVSAIMGRSPWANATDVWLQKTGRVIEETFAPWLEAGNYIERGILDWAEKQLGPLTRNQYRSRPEFHLGCHIDAVLNSEGEPVEGKSLGAFGNRAAEFGEPGTDQIPVDTIIQCHAHMIVLEEKTHPMKAHIPVLRPSLALVMYECEWDDGIADGIKEACAWFWDLVERDVRPPDIPHLEMVKKQIRTDGLVVPVDPDLVARWREVREEFKLAESAKDHTDAELVAAMEDGDCADGGWAGLVTYYKRKGKTTADRKKLEDAGLWDTYTKTGKPSRVPVWRAPKEEGD